MRRPGGSTLGKVCREGGQFGRCELTLSDPNPDQLPREVVKFRQCVQRLARDKFLVEYEPDTELWIAAGRQPRKGPSHAEHQRSSIPPNSGHHRLRRVRTPDGPTPAAALPIKRAIKAARRLAAVDPDLGRQIRGGRTG